MCKKEHFHYSHTQKRSICLKWMLSKYVHEPFVCICICVNVFMVMLVNNTSVIKSKICLASTTFMKEQSTNFSPTIRYKLLLSFLLSILSNNHVLHLTSLSKILKPSSTIRSSFLFSILNIRLFHGTKW